MSNVQEELWDTLSEMTGEEVLRHLTNYHGLQLLDEGFREHLVDEGVIPESEDDEEPVNKYAMDSFDAFCNQFHFCRDCPAFTGVGVDCEKTWNQMKEAGELK